MKIQWRVFLLLILVPLGLTLSVRADEMELFSESFTDSSLNLVWLPFPGFSPNHLVPVMDPTTPEGDLWVGRQSNEQLGGFASLSYAGESRMENYVLEAWVYTVVVPEGRAPLNGIAVRVDPEKGCFYRLASHFDSERRLTLAYVGRDTQNYPAYLGSWEGDEIPGGAPGTGGWHKMAITCVGNKIWAYWDGHELSGCPISDDRIARGFFGVYANYVGGHGIVETRVDGITVRRSGKLVKAIPR